MTGRNDIVIVGAGLAGLACGHELARRGRPSTILETNGWVGGLASTIEKDGFRFDTGPHRWYTKHDELNAWLHELLQDELITVPRFTRIHYRGKFFQYPLRLRDVFQLGMVPSLRILCDLLSRKARSRSTGELSLEDAFVEQFGSTLYERFFREYSEKLWGRKCAELSADWAFQRTRGLNLWRALKRMVWKEGRTRSLAGDFTYPRMGVGRIAEKMAEGVCSRGGVVHLSTEVVALHHRSEHIYRIDALHDENLLKVETEAVVSSMPITGLVHRLHPPAPNEVLQAASRLKFRNQIQVALLLNNEIRLPDNWVYVQDKMIPFTRFTIAHNFSRDLSPDGKTSVVFEVPCDEHDAVWKESDEAVIGLVRDHFIRHFGSLVQVEIIGAHVLRVEKEYPVFELGYHGYLDIITRYLSGFSNLQFIGRNGSFRYNNMDQSIMMGLRAARNLLGEQFNNDSDDHFSTDNEYLEERGA
jgi:protoporphyrinogen oxidase